MAGPIYVTSDQLKRWLKLPSNFTDDDDLVDSALRAAHEWIYKETGNRRFDLDAVATARTFSPSRRQVPTDDGMYRFLIDDVGSAAGLVVEHGTTSGGWTAVTDYEVGPYDALAKDEPLTWLERLAPWPCYGAERLRVTARWGWPAVPEAVVTACYIEAGRLYRRRASPEGVIAGAEWGAIRVSRSDPDAAKLLTTVGDPASFA